MKKRTVALAWVIIVLCAIYLIFVPINWQEQQRIMRVAPNTVAAKGMPILLGAIVSLSILILWVCLLYKRVLAWWVLSISCTIMYVGAFVVQMSSVSHLTNYSFGEWLVLSLVLGLPVLFLLTDRPSGWGKDSSPLKAKAIWKKPKRLKFIWKGEKHFQDTETHTLSSEDEDIAKKLVHVANCIPETWKQENRRKVVKIGEELILKGGVPLMNSILNRVKSLNGDVALLGETWDGMMEINGY